MKRIQTAPSLLDTTLIMLDAKQFIPAFKKNNIDSSILPLLTDDDLQVLGIADAELRNKFIRQCANLSLTDEIISNPTIDGQYIARVIHEIDDHLLLLNANLSYAMLCKNVKRSDVQFGNAIQCLVACAESLNDELISLHRTFVPVVKKKTNKWKYGFMVLLSSSVSLFLFRRLC